MALEAAPPGRLVFLTADIEISGKGFLLSVKLFLIFITKVQDPHELLFSIAIVT